MKNILTIVFLFFYFISFGQNYNKLIEKGKYSKVYKKCKKGLSKKPNDVLLNYFKSTVQSKKEASSLYNPEDAYILCLKTSTDFLNETDFKKLEAFSKIPLSNSLFINLIDTISRNALDDAIRSNSIDEYDAYINYYGEAPQIYIDKAFVKRNIVAFDQAKSKNKVEAYQYFIDTYPDAVQYDKAIELRNQVAFSNAKEENTIEGYESFINNYPDADQVDEANNQIHNIAFKNASKFNTVEAYQYFINTYPRANQKAKAILRRDELAYAAALEIDNSASYKLFCDNYPSSIQYSDAFRNYENKLYEEEIDTDDWHSYLSFVKNHPGNRNIQNALSKIYEKGVQESNSVALIFCIKNNFTGVSLDNQIIFLYDLVSKDGELSTLLMFSESFPNLIDRIDSYPKDLEYAQLAESIGLTTSQIIINENDEMSQRLKREGAKTGSIQISLIWNNYNDIDLHCIDPNGEEIYFGHRRSRTGGELDVDMNAGGPNSNEPVENIYWDHENAKKGEYKVYIKHFRNHNCYDCLDPTSYFVRIKYNNIIKEFRGDIHYGQPKREIFRFNFSDLDYGEIELTRENMIKLDKYIKGSSDKELAFVGLQKIIGEDIKSKKWNEALRKINEYKSFFLENEKYQNLKTILSKNYDNSINIKSLNQINGIDSEEYSPFISANNKFLYFCGVNRPSNIGGEDVFISKFINGNWQNPEIDNSLSDELTNDAVMSISADGNTIITFINGKLSYAHKTLHGWSDFIPFSDNINDCYWNGQAMISSDGNTLIFASLRENVYCNTNERNEFYHSSQSYLSDIYVSFKIDSEWSEPLNIGPEINTPYTERSPFLHPDMKTLYFSSDGHGGLGNLDVYKTTRLSDSCWNCWSEPINLGKEFNTEKDDWGYIISTNGKTAYFSKEYGTKQTEGIFKVNLPSHLRPNAVTNIEGRLINSDNSPISANIRWEDLETNEIIGSANTNPSDGSYFVILPSGKKYGYYIDHPDYFPISNNIDLRNINNNQQLSMDIPITTYREMINDSKAVPINNIFFNSGKHKLKRASFNELNRIIEIMTRSQFENVKIQIGGHTDNVGTKKLNQELSQKRAESVSEYLISNGISQSKIETKGFGFSQPVESNSTETGRQKNRRVEIKVMGYMDQ
jgi:outer membrane protein OmpA-like peptidoglycan-associated protein